MLLILNENAKMEDVKMINGKIDKGVLKKVSRRVKNNNAKLPIKLVAKMYKPTLAIELNKDTYLTQEQITSNKFYIKKISNYMYATNQGYVYNINRKRKNYGKANAFGYRVISTKNKTTTTMNNLLYNALVEPVGENVVHHKDHNKSNNALSNLALMTRDDNLRERFVNNPSLGKEMFSKICKNYIYDKNTKTLFKNKTTAAKYVNGLVAGVTACLDGRFKTYKGMELIQLTDEQQKEAEKHFIFNKNQKMINI
ncbi:HNH endonuclease [Ligilactobacillus cholophilus]|uniref:HNH endonuclease n=1 Tax=Ligilactobacillus cholophilus TaxID=3050131 RepID=UPI0025B16E7E|nr:HNH endonuclease [Ligilactobacillus cholophilus]